MSAAMGDVVGRATTASLAVVVLFVSCWCRWCEGACPDVERRALLELKQSINYPNGTALSTWRGHAGDEDCCRWPGVTCDSSTGHVIAVDLFMERTSGQGTWYPNLTMLTHLRELQILDLSGNQVGGWAFAPALCELKNLKVLDLSSNQIKGNLPPCLCNMSSLTTLDLDDNRLQGNIPPCLGNLYSLEYLWLGLNEFVGSIPASIFHNLTNLREIHIDGNHLEGWSSAQALCELKNLEVLNLGGNQIKGNLPPCLCNMSSLTTLHLYDNRLQGNIPPCLGNLYSLRFLRLGNNEFVGSIPASIFHNLTNLTAIWIGGDHLEGTLELSVFANLSKLTDLMLTSYGGLEIETESSSWVPSFQLNFMYIIRCVINKRSGHGIPSFISTQNHLTDLSLPHCSLAGKLPPDLTRNTTMLEWVDLSYNQMEGEMLPRDSYIPNLQFLYLGHNSFTGPISPRISNSSGLEVLDVTGNNLRCDLSRCLPVLGGGIRGLLLKDNSFEGHLPRHLCRIPYLQFLDVSMNNLSGEIPPCFNNISSWTWNTQQGLRQVSRGGFTVSVAFTSKYSTRLYNGGPLPLMTGLDLSSNKLDGNVPPELGGLKLQTLNLSYNHIWGSIPASFSNLRNVESLDLSHNYLNGTIPDGLAQLNFLATFSVAFNDLSGAIPTGGQFYTFNRSCYQGNAGLCGAPLEQNCSSKDTKQPDEVVRREDDEDHGILDNDTLFYSFVALSYVLGLWCVFAILLLHKRWRTLYFRAVDKYYDLYLRRFV